VAAQVEASRGKLRDAIYRAHLAGESVRDIAPYCGLSPSRVHDLIREARQLEEQ
jgi:DNA-directed RNA polymerase specialized sigma24 family protein